MPLPPAAARIDAHTRTVTFHAYAREDGLWDIEACMTDTKAYDDEAERMCGAGRRAHARHDDPGHPGQTIPHYQSHQWQPSPPATAQDAPPFYMGKCLAWDFDGPVVQRVAPQFAGWKPLKKL